MTDAALRLRTGPRRTALQHVVLAAVIGVAGALAPAMLARAWLALSGTDLLFNDSVSMPLGWYRKTAGRPVLTRGALVCVQAAAAQAPAFLRAAADENPAWRVEPLLKRLVGIAGDRVTYDGRAVAINGVALRSSALRPVDSSGDPLPRPPYPLTLRPGEVWVASEHPDGLDSRYFGPVSAAILSCAATPWLTF